MPVAFKDYYTTLGLSREATPDEIKRAYRKLARKYHPDSSSVSNRVDADQKIKEINEAYEVLKDPEKRRKYDQLGADWQSYEDFGGTDSAGAADGFRTRPGWNRYAGDFGEGGGAYHFSGTGFSDFFEHFFAGAGGAPFENFATDRQGGRHAPQRGADLEADLMVSLEEAYKGITRQVEITYRDARTRREAQATYKVRIPPGTRCGKQLRLSGKGDSGPGGLRGDLYLRVRIAPHPDYHLDGDDIIYDLRLAPWEAVLGARVEVPTLRGKVRLNIPPGTANGKRLRVKGHGFRPKSGAPGDFYALVQVEIPERLTETERKLWRQLAEHSNFKAQR
jgi:curved DNA-binding protein